VKFLVVSSYPPRHCGIGSYARDQVARLRADGHHVTVLSPPDGHGDVRAPFLGGKAFAVAARMGSARRFDSVIVHFQPALYYPPRAPLSKVLASVRLLWLAVRTTDRLEIVMHEADPPVRWRPDYSLLRLALRLTPKVRFHTDAERAAFERAYGIRVRSELLDHRVSPVAGASGAEARGRLGLDASGGPVFVCAGFLQPSKGFDRAVRAFSGAHGGRLFVVGSVRDPTPENEAHVHELRRLVQDVPGATLVEGFVTDEEFDLWVAAADWVVLPYRRAFSSGVLARAHALGTPAIVSAEGGLAEQAGPLDVVVDDDEELGAALRHRVAQRAGATS
jgi:glycosyltransferase involved in cell wall biosynthesis